MTDPEFVECSFCFDRENDQNPCAACFNNREAISLLLGVMKAAENVEGPQTGLIPAVKELHRAIRKAKGMT